MRGAGTPGSVVGRVGLIGCVRPGGGGGVVRDGVLGRPNPPGVVRAD